MGVLDLTQPQILIVDDDGDLRALAGDVLRGEGFSVAEAPNGKAALDYLFAAQTMPSLILLDMTMPVMSGPETIGLLRSHVRFSAIPVLVVTSSVRPEDSPKEGVVGRLEKPYGAEELLAIVREHLHSTREPGPSQTRCPR